MMLSINIISETMKTSIYDRIPVINTEDLQLLLPFWTRSIENRETTPKHDYHGKCLMRATLELEKRKKSQTTPPFLPLRETEKNE